MPILLIVYIATGIIAVLVAFFLYRSGLSNQAKIAAEKKKELDLFLQVDSPPDSIKKAVFEQVSRLESSDDCAREITKSVTELFTQEFKKKVEVTVQEISRKYESVVSEKARNEEMAWAKYKNVLSQKKETDAVIRSIAEGLVVVDSQGKVIMMNPAAEKLLGTTRGEKVGKPIQENLREEQLISMVKGSAEKENREIELISQQDETKKVLRASSAVIENENGHPIGMVSVLSDITKQKELDQMKNNLVANVTHELRTPLIAIGKSISLILSKATGDLSSDQEKFLTIADRNLKRLSLLINDLLDLSKLEAGRMELKYQECAIDKIINESVDGLLTWANTKSINVERNIQAGLPNLNVDPNRIIQVLNNLIGNAVKFTPANGTIRVEANLHREKREIEVSVNDTGIGINKENLSKIFDKFFQVGERAPTDISGTGIGLSIAKEFVELHGGRIWAESQDGGGTTFAFTLPLKENSGG